MSRRGESGRHQDRRYKLNALVTKEMPKIEEEITKILFAMIRKHEIFSYIAHPANSIERREGKYFTITTHGLESMYDYSFGVTPSLHLWNQAKLKYPKVPQLCVLLNMKPESIRERILELFSSPPSP